MNRGFKMNENEPKLDAEVDRSHHDATGLEAEVGDAHEETKQRLDDSVVEFMAGLFERLRNSTGRSLEDFVDQQTEWYQEANPSPP